MFDENQKASKDIVTTLAYLTGVRCDILETHYSHTDAQKESLERLRKNEDATTLRNLCILRTTFMSYFLKIEREINALKGIRNMPDIICGEARDAIDYLEKHGTPVVMYNKKTQDYCDLFNKLITAKVDKVKALVPGTIDWALIRDLFVIPNFAKKQVSIREFEKYNGNRDRYPFQVYIHWDIEKLTAHEERTQIETGNVFANDLRFATIIHMLNDVRFTKQDFLGASASLKQSIYDFVDDAGAIDIIVDCENVDPVKFHCMMQSISKGRTSKVRKIILFDDPNTSDIWQVIAKQMNAERIEVGRLIERKSMVDMKLALECQNAHIKENVDSFILVASDSDYWTLISTVSTADFYVIGEQEKCSQRTLNAFQEHNIRHCFLDTFGTAHAVMFKKRLVLDRIKEMGGSIIGMDVKLLVKQILTEYHIDFTTKELDDFCRQYIKSISFTVDSTGKACLVYKEIK